MGHNPKGLIRQREQPLRQLGTMRVESLHALLDLVLLMQSSLRSTASRTPCRPGRQHQGTREQGKYLEPFEALSKAPKRTFTLLTNLFSDILCALAGESTFPLSGFCFRPLPAAAIDPPQTLKSRPTRTYKGGGKKEKKGRKSEKNEPTQSRGSKCARPNSESA